ncbi:hypothetical protein D770_14575 [Flammeovirgaceae bacterium 311]|nr:hypothetical protein D770_14575 [Flammeovirgaceae bacterium 311]
MKYPIFLKYKQAVYTVLVLSMIGLGMELNAQDIIPYTKNPRYWQYKGKPVMLLGANKTDSPYLLPNQEAYYDSLASKGGNYTRYVVKQRLVPDLVQIFPFQKGADGMYDLNQWNEEYWERFEQGIKLTAARNIVLQLELWDRFDIGSEHSYKVSTWRPENNINYTEQESGLPNQWKGDDAVIHKHPFFAAVPALDNNKFLLQLQQKYADKVLSIALKYDHILYVVTNESTLNPEWSKYWATYIREKADAMKKKVQISEMPWTIADRFPFDWQHTALGDPDKWINHVIEHPELYSFSAFQFQPIMSSRQDHYDRLTEIYKRVQTSAGGPRPVNAVKVFASERIFGGANDANRQARFWRPLMAGWAAVSLHRQHPNSPYLGFSDKGQRNLAAARKFSDAIKPWECTPSQQLLHNRESDEAYVLANPGRAYGIYFPASGTIDLELTKKSTTYYLQWISIETGEYVEAPIKIKAKNRLTLQTPDSGSGEGWAATLTTDSSVLHTKAK